MYNQKHFFQWKTKFLQVKIENVQFFSSNLLALLRIIVTQRYYFVYFLFETDNTVRCSTKFVNVNLKNK